MVAPRRSGQPVVASVLPVPLALAARHPAAGQGTADRLCCSQCRIRLEHLISVLAVVARSSG